MTAEIGILNKQGVVLAADSAVTIGGGKVYNSASKLFTLSANHSIGFMVYGDAEFVGVPWEVLIKKFSLEVGNAPLDTIDNYVSLFFSFLNNKKDLFRSEVSDEYVYFYSLNLANFIFEGISIDINEVLSRGGNVDDAFVIERFNEKIINLKEIFKDDQLLVNIEENNFSEQYKDIVLSAINSVSTKQEVTNEICYPFYDLVYDLICKENTFQGFSGIVIAGYGKNEVFPTLKSFKFHTILDNKLKFSSDKQAKIDSIDDHDRQLTTSAILPFAQDDVVSTVIAGIAPSVTDHLFRTLESYINEETLKEVSQSITNYQNINFISPMINTVSILPIDELADVAETLINLTSFKRKYTSELETVGGPIDVLAITMAEGPVWIKRKHYFDINNNVNFKIRKENFHEYYEIDS